MIQKLFVVLFVLALTVGSLTCGDYFPFTSAARFRDPVASYWQFQVFDPNGRELPPASFDLQRNFAGQPVGQGTGRIPPASLNRLGNVEDEATAEPTPAVVEEWVQQRFESAWEKQATEGQPWSFVTVNARRFGPVGQAVDVQESFRVTVFNPARGL